VQSQEGEAWLGLAAFYYRGNTVSDLYVQLSSDAAGGFIFWDPDWDVTAWGRVPMARTPGSIAHPRLLARNYRAEQRRRPPLRPLAALGHAVERLAPIAHHPNCLTVGILMDRTLHHSAVRTPFGPHPYPGDMRVGVWSASKSLVSGLAALRLAHKYGKDFLATRIIDYFEEGREFRYADGVSKARWGQVTIWHALHMTTGMGPTGYDTNWALDNLNTYQWSYSYDLADQIRFYFNQTPNPDVTGPFQKFA